MEDIPAPLTKQEVKLLQKIEQINRPVSLATLKKHMGITSQRELERLTGRLVRLEEVYIVGNTIYISNQKNQTLVGSAT